MSKENPLPAATRAARWSRRPWQREFPYRWDADELVSRRELLNFAVYSSGALFVATAILAALGFRKDQTPPVTHPIARLSDVPPGSAVYFHYPYGGLGNEAMLLHLPNGQLAAYSQTCTHLSCGVYYQPERQRLYCPCHDGVFDPASGNAVAGPPQRPLPRLTLRQENGVVLATGWER